MIVDLILPALNEEPSLPAVLRALPRAGLRHIVVVDNGSTDGTAKVAREAGARVIFEPRQGYGRALWTGIESLAESPPEVVAFLDADGADDPTALLAILNPLAQDEADFVVGSRMLGSREPGSMSPVQLVGNQVVPLLLRLAFDARYTDLGPLRAIRYDALMRLGLVERGMGFTVEMQIRATQEGLRVVEVPVPYRRRVGRSKISGTLRGTIRATAGILAVVARLRFGQSLRR